jgi:signal transduction histidine kinase
MTPFLPAKMEFHRKVQLLLTTAVAGALIVSAVALFVFQVSETRQLLAANLTSLARATASNCSAAVVFGNAADARETMNALTVSPSVRSALLTTADGSPVATYTAAGTPTEPAPDAALETLTAPVLAKGETVGYLKLSVDYSADLRRLTRRYAVAVFVVTLLAALLALAIAKKIPGRFSLPLRRLAALADQLVDRKDYALRAPEATEHGEVAAFTRAFNQMLDRVQSQDRALDAAHALLQRQVEQLTYEVGERHRMERERIELERKVLAAQKLESLGVLAGGIAHDFNNLLTPIIGNLSVVAIDLPPDSALAEPVRDSLQAARTAANLCRQMLAYAGKGRFEFAPLELNATVEDCRALLTHSVGKRIALTFDLCTEACPVFADRTQLQQIMMNLVINASEAVGDLPAGRIAVRTARLAAINGRTFPRCTPASPPPGDYVLLEVGDNGPGMSDAVCQRIFEPFFTTKFTGRGLGLAAVLGIVAGHKGYLSIETAPGQGTTFRVLLPATVASVHTEAAPPSPVPPRTKGTVLIIDDEPLVRKVAAAACTRLGLRTLLAANGSEGIELFRQHAADIVIVLLDQTMPGLDGGATFVSLNAIKSGVQVILMSGHSEKEAQKNFPALQLAGFLQKPFDFGALSAALSKFG